MKYISTYCSANKDKAKALLPAYQRYKSPRINRVKDIAENEGVHFCILSGEYGLIDWDKPIPWYNHLLVQKEVPEMIEKLVEQIACKHITSMDFYSQSQDDDPNIIPYLTAIDQACQELEIILNVHTLEVPHDSYK